MAFSSAVSFGQTTIALAKACADLAAGRLGNTGKALFLSFARATVARVAEQATATIPREQLARIEINTYHGFAWTILKSHAYLLCARPGLVHTRNVGTTHMNSLRRDELESRFPGLLASVLSQH